MKQILARFFVNIVAVLFLSLLLLGPTAFSATFVTFEKDQVLAISQEDYRFGDFLKIKKETKEVSQSQFNITFTAFPQKQALYRDILKLTNNSNTSQVVKISNLESPQANIFFAQSDNSLEGSIITTIDSGNTVTVHLLALPAKGQTNEVIDTSFTLEVE
jgi:hypothetical protein